MQAQTSTLLKRPPANFTPAGVVTWARLHTGAPPFIRQGGKTKAQRQGIKYEKLVHEAFQESYKEQYLSSQWLAFKSGSRTKVRWCQPDSLIIDPRRGKITLVEVKYNHTAQAWWQLYALYLPVIAKIFGTDWEYACCEVVKWYDPAVVCPQRPTLLKEINEAKRDNWSVHIFNPR